MIQHGRRVIKAYIPKYIFHLNNLKVINKNNLTATPNQYPYKNRVRLNHIFVSGYKVEVF